LSLDCGPIGSSFVDFLDGRLNEVTCCLGHLELGLDQVLIRLFLVLVSFFLLLDCANQVPTLDLSTCLE